MDEFPISAKVAIVYIIKLILFNTILLFLECKRSKK